MREKARAIVEKAYQEAHRMKEVEQIAAEETEKATFYSYDEIIEAFNSYNPEEDQDEYMLDIVTLALEGDL